MAQLMLLVFFISRVHFLYFDVCLFVCICLRDVRFDPLDVYRKHDIFYQEV